MKKFLVVLAIMAIFTTPAFALVTNGGFETGTTAGWTVNDANRASVVTSWSGDYGTYLPQEGSYFLELQGGLGDYVYTTASQSIVLVGGDILSGMAAFDGRETSSYWTDNAYVRILNGAGALVATPWSDTQSGKDYPYDGSWTSWNWTAPNSGTYTLQYGVANGGDNAVDPFALFDAAEVNNVVPEPASLSLLGLGLLGLLRKKR
jgi:hypothetical protein